MEALLQSRALRELAERDRVARELAAVARDFPPGCFTPAERAEGISVTWGALEACGGMGGVPRAWDPLRTATLQLAVRLGFPRNRADEALRLAKKAAFGVDLVELAPVRTGQAALQMYHARAVLEADARGAIERLMVRAQAHAKRNEQPLPAAIEVVVRELHEGQPPSDPFERLGIQKEIQP